LFAKHGITPRQGWGQNFLVSSTILEKIIEAADIKKTDRILEVGGGAGTLTQELARRAKEVTVIEKDPELVLVLKDALRGFKNVKIVEGDVLKLDALPYSQSKAPWRIVSNIPYWITGRFLRHALESKNPPTEILLMLQKEIAERICAQPPRMSLLAVSVQYYGTPEILINNILPDNFWPPSGVDSAIIKIKVGESIPPKKGSAKFFTVVRAGFAHPRKQLRANLKRALKLDSQTIDDCFTHYGIKTTARAQELSVRNWECLAAEIKL